MLFLFLKKGVGELIYPSFDQFVKLSQDAALVPVALEIAGDLETPISLFMKLGQSENSYILESVEGGQRWARYSYIGRSPCLIITARGNLVSVYDTRTNTTISQQGDVLAIIAGIMGEFKPAKTPGLPDFSGGAVGYFAYDVARSYQKVKNVKAEQSDPLNMPDIHLLLTNEVIVYDHVKQKIILIVNAEPGSDPKTSYQNAVERLREIQTEIEKGSTPAQAGKAALGNRNSSLDTAWNYSTESKDSFMHKVNQIKQLIEQGEAYQVVLSQRFALPTEADPFGAYRVLRSLNPSPYLFYINCGEYQLVGASPELLVKVTDDLVETCPIAGTRPRGKTPEEDQAYAEELRSDEKELAEHLMLVDLGRNDIGRVAEFGTVAVKNLLHVEKYSHVMHLVTNVVGRLKQGATMFDALKACLPAGTVSGAPKLKAMEIIDQLEREKRGVYAGAVGYLGFNGNMDLCIAIRTILFKGQTAFVQAGAGIVWDSDPETEYEETLRKAKAMLEAIKQGEVG